MIKYANPMSFMDHRFYDIDNTHYKTSHSYYLDDHLNGTHIDNRNETRCNGISKNNDNFFMFRGPIDKGLGHGAAIDFCNSDGLMVG